MKIRKVLPLDLSAVFIHESAITVSAEPNNAEKLTSQGVQVVLANQHMSAFVESTLLMLR